MVLAQGLSSSIGKDRDRIKWKETFVPTSFYRQEYVKRFLNRTPQAFSYEKGIIQGTGPRDIESPCRVELSPNKRTGKMLLAGFQKCWEPVDTVCFSYPHFHIIILFLYHNCMFWEERAESHNFSLLVNKFRSNCMELLWMRRLNLI